MRVCVCVTVTDNVSGDCDTLDSHSATVTETVTAAVTGRACEMRKLQIQVLTRDGRKNVYETDRFRNVADLKKHIGRNMNVPMAFSRLTYKGRLLTNDSILEDEGVKRMSTLELYWQPLVLTPKQYREKELELDKQDQKQRHVSRIADNYEQTVRRAGHERTPSGIRCNREQVRAKRSLSADDMKPAMPTMPTMPTPAPTSTPTPTSTATATPTPTPTPTRHALLANEELSSTSSDEQDFLSAYWCCPKSGMKISRAAAQAQLKEEAAAAGAGAEAGAEAGAGVDDMDYSGDPDVADTNRLKPAVASCCELQGNSKYKTTDDTLLDEILEQRCLGCRVHQPSTHQFRTGLRLTAGRMSRSIISNIRKIKKNRKK